MNSMLLRFNDEKKVLCEFKNSEKYIDITGHAETSMIDTKAIINSKYKVGEKQDQNLFVVKNPLMLSMAKMISNDNKLSALYLRDNKNNHMFIIDNNIKVEYKN